MSNEGTLPPFVSPANEYSDDPEKQNDDGTPPPPDPTPDATDTRAMREKRKARREYEENVALFWQSIFSTQIGRKVMWEWLESLHTFEDRVMTGHGFPDIYAVGLAAGEKSAGMRLFLTWLRYDRDGVNRMMDDYHPDFRKPAPPARTGGQNG